MKQKFSVLSIIGSVLGITFNNIGAGMCLGLAATVIATLVLNDYHDNR